MPGCAGCSATASSAPAAAAICSTTSGRRLPEGQDNCGNCDNCLDPEADAAEFDGTEIAQKILSAVHRTGARFGMAHVTEVLRGSRSRKVLQFRHDRLSVHGIARDVPAEELRDLADQLVDRGLLLRAAGEFPTVSIAPAGWRFLRAGERITLTRPRSAPPEPRQSRVPAAAAVAAPGGAATPPPPEIEADLFETLRDLRRRLAERDGLRPFHVCGDRTLSEVAAFLPQSGGEPASRPRVRPRKAGAVRHALPGRRSRSHGSEGATRPHVGPQSTHEGPDLRPLEAKRDARHHPGTPRGGPFRRGNRGGPRR